jgi:hypothetical protein
MNTVMWELEEGRGRKKAPQNQLANLDASKAAGFYASHS